MARVGDHSRALLAHHIAPAQLAALREAGFSVVSSEDLARLTVSARTPQRLTPPDLVKPSIREIAVAVARASGLSVDQLMSAERRHSVTRPRQLAMFIAVQCFGFTISRVATSFLRDHSTVSHARKIIRGRLDEGDDLTLALFETAQTELQKILELRMASPNG